MRHVIVGGCGFTGTHLRRRLVELGEDVLVVDLAERVAARGLAASEAHAADLEDPTSVASIPLRADDTLHHLAARQLFGPGPRRRGPGWFTPVNVAGTERLLERMVEVGCRRMTFFSTDMVYGVPMEVPVPADHPRRPLGPYGASKRLAENLCVDYRRRGVSVTIFRPRLIVGPGRLGVLARLFGLIERGLPVPLIGDGRNHFQMISVFDCVSAVEAALERGVPDNAFNLGSLDPPPVRELLRRVINAAGSRSRLVPLPARPVKAVLQVLDAAGRPLLYREQFAIADADYVVDVSATVKELGWRPRQDDADMLALAYAEYRAGR